MKRALMFASVVFLFVLVALVATLPAQEVKRVPAKPTATLDGADSFRSYCASCHGVRGMGAGPAARALTTKPTDLTQIAKKAGGTFSAKDVEDAIMGRNKTFAAHGSGEMPVWGPIFRALNSSDTALTTLRVANLVDYIKTIQAK